MKKYLTVALITSCIMLAVLGSVVFLLLRSQASQEDIILQQQQEELDLLISGKKKESVDKDNVVTLYRDGNSKNVVTFAYNNVKDIYNVTKSEQIKKQIVKLERKNDYTFESPFWAYNPFGTNSLSLYLYFKTVEFTYLKYTVTVEDAAIPDFTRTLQNDGDNNLAEEHEYQLTGLVPGMENYLVLKLYNQNDQVVNSISYKIDLSDVKTKAPTKMATTTGNSFTDLSNGLFGVFGMADTEKKIEPAIYFYDNSGILRGIIPLMNYQSDSLEFIDNTMVFNYGIRNFASVNSLGQVVDTYSLGKYKQHHDFVYDGFGHLLVLATDPNKQNKSVQDLVVSLDLRTGKVKKLIDMEKLLPKMKSAAKKAAGSKVFNWIQLNSISMSGTNDIVVSSRELSSVIRINQINSKKPVIQYIISEQSIWDDTDYEDMILEKTVIDGENSYNAQFGQNDVIFEKDASLSDGQYYLTMFNNNYGYSPTRPKFDWSSFMGIGTKNHTANQSLFYKYLVDDTAGTYELIRKIDVPYSSTLGSVHDYKGNYIINSGKAAIYGEYDTSGSLIREFKGSTKSDLNKVYKYDMKGFWFQ